MRRRTPIEQTRWALALVVDELTMAAGAAEDQARANIAQAVAVLEGFGWDTDGGAIATAILRLGVAQDPLTQPVMARCVEQVISAMRAILGGYLDAGECPATWYTVPANGTNRGRLTYTCPACHLVMVKAGDHHRALYSAPERSA